MSENTAVLEETSNDYEKSKQSIRTRRIEEKLMNGDILEDEWSDMTKPRSSIGPIDVAKVGTGILIGGGLGLLAGVATIAVAASAAEIVIGGVITKVCGVVGGAAGMGWGMKKMDKKKQQGL